MADSKWPRILWCRMICRLFPLTSTISGACSAARDIVLHRVSDLGQGFDKLGAFGGVFERLPEMYRGSCHVGSENATICTTQVHLSTRSGIAKRINSNRISGRQPTHSNR